MDGMTGTLADEYRMGAPDADGAFESAATDGTRAALAMPEPLGRCVGCREGHAARIRTVVVRTPFCPQCKTDARTYQERESTHGPKRFELSWECAHCGVDVTITTTRTVDGFRMSRLRAMAKVIRQKRDNFYVLLPSGEAKEVSREFCDEHPEVRVIRPIDD